MYMFVIRDCAEASCETCISVASNVLDHRYSLNMDRLEKQCINKSLWKPDTIQQEKEWIMECVSEYFQRGHFKPFVMSKNFKYEVSSSVDKVLGNNDKRRTCEQAGFDLNGIDDE